MRSAASLKTGMCGLTDGSTAGQWRLPTKDELVAMQRSQQGFNNINPSYYWSSTTYTSNTANAWYVFMNTGIVGNVGKDSNFFVWAVRSGQ